MARRWVIIGVGEALLAEHPDREEPAGLACLIAIGAARLGHEGIAVSRVGQDEAGRALLKKLREAGADAGHVQTDPDLATGRLVVRSFGGASRLDAHAAFDNFQWDFDLADIAQRADAVVFGEVIRRTGQSRSTTDRFLAECRQALRVCDLTSRAGDRIDRAIALSGLRLAQGAITDLAALPEILPGAAEADAAASLLRRGGLSFVLVTEPGRPICLHTPEASPAGSEPHDRQQHEAAVVGFLHGVLSGATPAEAVSLAERVARHARERPGEAPPPALLERANG